MSITKKKIAKDISSKIDITERESLDILEAFISNIKTMSQKKLMISNFGVFHVKTTKKRIGRNPKTKKEYDTLFVKGQQLYKHRYHILKFLDLPISSNWIKNHKRNSDWFSCNKKEKEGLYNIYGGFNDFILSQPDIQIQKKNTLEIIPLSISDSLSSRIKNPNI